MRRRALAGQLDQLKADRNEAARGDAVLVKEKGALPAATTTARRDLGARIATLEADLKTVEATLEAKLLYVPNLPLPEVPDGDESHNQVVRTWGEPAPQGGPPHWEIAEGLGLVDFGRGAKLAGSGFPLFVGLGARLARALIAFMLDIHVREHGYIEVAPPYLARREVMQGTGQLPKFEADVYRTEPDDLFLIPTAEVPVTNLLRDETVDGATLPRGYVAYTPCFRREAGAAGKDTRGLLRVHQFDKVELVRFCRAAGSAAEHEQLTGHAEAVLRLLELPYRVVLLAAGDLGFASAKTYDLEVWAPGVGAWLECSSSSTFTDFQARRGHIRCRPQRPGAGRPRVRLAGPRRQGRLAGLPDRGAGPRRPGHGAGERARGAGCRSRRAPQLDRRARRREHAPRPARRRHDSLWPAPRRPPLHDPRPAAGCGLSLSRPLGGFGVPLASRRRPGPPVGGDGPRIGTPARHAPHEPHRMDCLPAGETGYTGRRAGGSS